jgi:hypothetical protein
LVYGLDGKLRTGNTPGDLTPLELALPRKFILVRALANPGATWNGSPELLAIAGAPSGDWESLPDLHPTGAGEVEVAANWKLMVEQWLEALPRPKDVRRTFLPPNQLLEVSSTDALILQVIPESPVECRIRRMDYSVGAGTRRRKARQQAPRPLAWLLQDIEVAESTQRGLTSGAAEAQEASPVAPELAEFRRSVAALLPGLEAARRGS